MKKLLIFTMTLLSFTFLNAQCDFPRNTNTNQFQNAIQYDGEIYRTNFGGGSVFRIEPSKLSFKRNEITGDTFPTSNHGVWLMKWNYAASPNRWQPLPTDCSATSVTLKSIFGEPITKGWLECDFFYYDEHLGVSATFLGAVRYEIKEGKLATNKVHPTYARSPF